MQIPQAHAQAGPALAAAGRILQPEAFVFQPQGRKQPLLQKIHHLHAAQPPDQRGQHLGRPGIVMEYRAGFVARLPGKEGPGPVPVLPFPVGGLGIAGGHPQHVPDGLAEDAPVREEWKRFHLLEHVDLLCTQEMGSKAYCIGKLVEKGYEAILMCGDAPGDEQAARKNGALYYPILVNRENESWKRFLQEGLPRFLSGAYAGDYQETLRNEFNANLGL